MKYDSIPFSLIDPSNLTAIAEGTRRIEELMTSPLWANTYNTYAADNTVNVDFFKGQALEQDGVPVQLAKMMAKAVRDAFRAGSNAYMMRIGAAALTEDEWRDFVRLPQNAKDIMLIFSVLCSCYQVGKWGMGVPEICFTAALVQGIQATETVYQYQARPVYVDPLADFPAVRGMREDLKKYPALNEFATVYFKAQSSLMLEVFVEDDSAEGRLDTARKFGESTFAIGMCFVTVAPNVKELTVQQLGSLLATPTIMAAMAIGIMSDDARDLVGAQEETLSQFYTAMSRNLLSPMMFCQMLFVAGVDYALTLREAKF